MKIDIHNHILPDSWPNLREKYGYGGWIQLEKDNDGHQGRMMMDGKLFRVVDENCWSIEKRLEEMNANRVDIQVLSTVPVMFSYWAKPEDTLDLCKLCNDNIASHARKYPKRFVGFGSLPMQEPKLAIEELRRCKNELGFPGVQIGSHVNDWNLDAEQLQPFFAEAERLEMSIFVHPWDMEQCGRMSKYFLPWLVGMPAETCTAICSVLMGGVLQRFPNLKICFAHGGGSFPFTIGRIEKGFNVRPDLCAVECEANPRDFIGKFYTDSLVHDSKALMHLIEVIGEEKILLGTDYPFPLAEWPPGKTIESIVEFSDDIKDKLLAKNALEFLNLNRQDFQ